MKIGHTPEKPIPVNPTQQSVPAKVGQGASPSTRVATARSGQAAGVAVTVSPLARALDQTDRVGIADVDMQKVESVRLAIEQGTYTVNPEAIADKLLANAQEMLNRTHS